MSYGLWVMGYGLWVMGYGLWVMGYGLWVMGYEFSPYTCNVETRHALSDAIIPCLMLGLINRTLDRMN